MKYTVVLQQEPDVGYVAIVPALPGCASQGDSRKEAIDLYLEDVIDAGEPYLQNLAESMLKSSRVFGDQDAERPFGEGSSKGFGKDRV